MTVSGKQSLEETVRHVKYVLLDVEGTMTAISFLKDTLYPNFYKHVEKYVYDNWDTDEFRKILSLLQEQAAIDVDSKFEGVVPIPPEGSVNEQQYRAIVLSNIMWQMGLNRKTTSLKHLQGIIWRKGFINGEFKGHVYPDVAPAFKRWTESGLKLYIYSSGSVEAQKLLVKYSLAGDLSGLFSGYFDTTVGRKAETNSYKAIVKSLNCKPDNIIFLTDVPIEARAANAAGVPAILVEREGNAKLSEEDRRQFNVIRSFADIKFPR